REILRTRLTRRGLALSASALAGLLSQNVLAAVPAPLTDSTTRAAVLFAAGYAATAGGASAPVTALTEGVIKAMMMTKLKTAAAFLLAVGLLMGGLGWLTYQTLAGPPLAPPENDLLIADLTPSAGAGELSATT